MTTHEQLLERDREWSAAAAAGRDVEYILSFWTDDAVVLAPGLPPLRGKDALRAFVLQSLSIPGFKISWTSTDVVFSADQTLAYMFSNNAVTMNAADGKPATTQGRAVTIWKREQDGEWRCAVDIWNS